MIEGTTAGGVASFDAFNEVAGATRVVLSYLLGVRLDADHFDTIESSAHGPIRTTWFPGRRHLITQSAYPPLPLGAIEWSECRTEYANAGLGRWPLDGAILSHVIERFLEHPGIHTPIEYLLRFHEAPLEMRGAFLSVALEALTAVLKRVLRFEWEPLLPDAQWTPLQEELGEVVAKHAIHEWKGAVVGSLSSRVRNLNEPPNSEKLRKPFELLGVALTADEYDAIKARNKLLHQGRFLSDDDRSKPDAWKKAYRVEMLMYTAINKLLLRFLEYRGPIINWGESGLDSPKHTCVLVETPKKA